MQISSTFETKYVYLRSFNTQQHNTDDQLYCWSLYYVKMKKTQLISICKSSVYSRLSHFKKNLECWLSHIFFRCWNFLNKHILSQMCLISALLWLYLLIIFFSSILHIILVVEKCSVRLSIFYIFMSILFLLTLATIFFSQKFLFVRP
jgi:hypothetical protein